VKHTVLQSYVGHLGILKRIGGKLSIKHQCLDNEGKNPTTEESLQQLSCTSISTDFHYPLTLQYAEQCPKGLKMAPKLQFT
jgi:hypothetical protein